MASLRNRAIGLMQSNRFEDAIPLLLQETESNPHDASAQYMLGQCYRFTQNIPEAVRSLKIAAALDPNDPQILLALGIAHQLAEDYADSEKALRSAIDLNPSLWSAYNSLGLTLKKAERYREALDLYCRAAEGVVAESAEVAFRDPDQCMNVEMIEGRKSVTILPGAFESTRDALRADPRYAIFKNNIGVCLAELGYIEAAKEQFEESIEFIPDGYEYPDPHVHLERIG